MKWEHRLVQSVALVGLGGMIFGCQPPAPKAHEEESAATVTAEVQTVTKTEVAQTEELVGAIRPLLQSTLSTKISGRVTAITAREGDLVQKGQALVTIDSQELASAVQVAEANRTAATVGIGSAQTAAGIESRTSAARIAEARAQVRLATAALQTAQARRDQAKNGSRVQEVAQSHAAVVQAESSLNLAKVELDRVRNLVEQGALARKQLDIALNQFEVAKGRLDAALAAESMVREGSRSEELRAAESGVDQAQAALAQAMSGLRQANAAALQTEIRRQDVRVAEAQRQQADAAVQSAKVTLSYGQVSAPFSGRVVQRWVDPGTMATPGAPLLTVEGGEFRLEATVPESLVPRLKKGTPLAVRIDALPGKTFSGTLKELLPQADRASHTFLARFSLGTPPKVRSGMFGRVSLLTDQRKAIMIPQTATWEREGLHYVFSVNPEGKVRLRLVTLGEIQRGRVEVLSGLSEGDRIVTSDRKAVRDGVKVVAR